MNLQTTVKNMFLQIENVLAGISGEAYVMPVATMSGATIGEHTRHIVEFYIELLKGYKTGTINYDNRERDFRIATDRYFAIQNLQSICNDLKIPDKALLLVFNFSCRKDHPFTTSTNYTRELVYNLEHTVHHMALMRVAVNSLTTMQLPADFGVAASTLQFRESCAQ